MAKIRVIKKNDDYSMDYQVGDILEVTGTWYGGINVNSKTGIPLCLDKDEYEEIPENTDLSHEEYERAANYWKEKDAQSKKLDPLAGRADDLYRRRRTSHCRAA